MADEHVDPVSIGYQAVTAAIDAVRPLIVHGVEFLVRACEIIDQLLGTYLGAEARRHVAEIVWETLTSPDPTGEPGPAQRPGLRLAGDGTPR